MSNTKKQYCQDFFQDIKDQWYANDKNDLKCLEIALDDIQTSLLPKKEERKEVYDKN